MGSEGSRGRKGWRRGGQIKPLGTSAPVRLEFSLKSPGSQAPVGRSTHSGVHPSLVACVCVCVYELRPPRGNPRRGFRPFSWLLAVFVLFGPRSLSSSSSTIRSCSALVSFTRLQPQLRPLGHRRRRRRSLSGPLPSRPFTPPSPPHLLLKVRPALLLIERGQRPSLVPI